MVNKINLYRNPNSHKGDTSRELFDMWSEAGYCNLIDCDSTISWLYDINDVLLYEFNCEPNVPVPDKDSVNLGLFGNYKPNDWGLHWVFWARRPRILEEKIDQGILNLSQRNISSIFIGNNENYIQKNNRIKADWSSAIEQFSMIDGNAHRYTQEEYLNLMATSKYGLCLAGYGRKCNRDVECMGLGTVPLVAPEVDMNYYDLPQEGIHYFRVNGPQDIVDIINNLSESDWKWMSDNCVDWWHRNCSCQGSFNTTLSIIDKHHGK